MEPRMTKLIACACLLVAGLTAQKRPDFTGTWIVSVPAKSAGKEYVVKHDDKSLHTTMSRRPTTYLLDGTEQLSQVPMSGDVIRISTRAGWEKDRIVIIENTAYPTGMKTTVRETWSLDAKGQLVIDTVETMAGLPNKPDIQQRVLIRKK
jgi:hypothetical protein